MSILIEMFLAIASWIGDILISFHIEELQKYEKELTACLMIILVLAGICFVCHVCGNRSVQKEVDHVFLSTCKEFFEHEEYAHILEMVKDDKFKSAESCMVYAYCLAYGYGVDQDIPLSIEYYKKANDKGATNAISNMVVSVVKNCHTEVKIDAVKYAFDSGNEMAIKYVDYVVRSWNSKTENSACPITVDSIWNLGEKTLLEILEGPFYRWICSTRTYKTSVSTSSTPSFTRRFLYQNGENRVYEECQLVADDSYPNWLQETIW